jgi:hypothetical protein
LNFVNLFQSGSDGKQSKAVAQTKKSEDAKPTAYPPVKSSYSEGKISDSFSEHNPRTPVLPDNG